MAGGGRRGPTPGPTPHAALLHGARDIALMVWYHAGRGEEGLWPVR